MMAAASARAPFRRAVITDEVSQDPRDAIRLAGEFGLDGLEIRSVWGKRPDDLTAAEIQALRTMIEDAGLVVSAVATPCFKCALDDPLQVQTHFGMLKRCLDLCAALRAPIARIFTFWRPEGEIAHVTEVWRRCAAEIAGHLHRAAATARSWKVRLGIENEPAVFTSTCERVAEALRLADHPALGAVWDPANNLYGQEGERPYPDGYLALRDALLHVHLKDALRDPQTGTTQAVSLGHGEVPWRDIFRSLATDTFDGFVSLETHYRAAPLSAEAARLPGGPAFSAGGLEASTICLRRWNAMLAGIERADAGHADPDRGR
jgi:sugar phosphate isomerase/epimerase